MQAEKRRPLSWRRKLALLWGCALVLSYLAWWRRPAPTPVPEGAGRHHTRVAEISGDELTGRTLELAWREWPARSPDSPTLLLLHGSPGDKGNFESLARAIDGRLRLIAPDLPGFGESPRAVADYSIQAHAHEVLELLHALGVERLHVLGFSMGGGVALQLANIDPARLRSLILLSAIGVQELELLGSYELNHAVHGLQLSLVLFARWCLPHFGLDDGFASARAYARNFYDSDQRPLRPILESLTLPVLILHGERDFLVPAAAAREHERLVPQAELQMVPSDHFMLWRDPQGLAERLLDWVERDERGLLRTRAQASPERLAGAVEPFDPSHLPPFEGPALLVLLLLIAAGTLASEDLACIAAGLLVAQGRIGFLPATLAAFLGIFVGDVGLYLVGRFLGRPALEHRPLRWLVSPESIERAKSWFAHRGARVIFLSRFLPGLRLPTYFAAGAVRARFLLFCAYFVLAGLVWTPLLVGLAATVGAEAVASFGNLEQMAWWGIAGVALLLLLVQRLLVPLFSWRGRRLLLGAWRRRIAFEFWPPWIFYVPVAARIAWLALRHRGLTVFTAANPGIETGGFVGESKSRILSHIEQGQGDVARFVLLPASLPAPERHEFARAFMLSRGLDFPVVLKPDVGQRGSGVSILADAQSLRVALDSMRVDSILQEHAPGQELGVFYIRHPDEAHGRIFSITEKRLPRVVGDGERNLEELILADERAVCMAPTYFRINAARLLEVPARGEQVALVELGTHARGAIFLNGAWARTAELEQAIERISRRFEGFHFGRYDLRVHDLEALPRGEGFRVIELNGVTSEATHIYDPRTKLLEAWRVLFEQWGLAYSIGARNRDRGARIWSMGELARAWRGYRRLQSAHLPTGWQWGLAAGAEGDPARAAAGVQAPEASLPLSQDR